MRLRSRNVHVARRLARAWRVSPILWALPGAIAALTICGYQLSLPNVLSGIHGFSGNGYDDGVYLTAAKELLRGVVPYHDYVFLQPPGIILALVPVVAIAHGTTALAMARILTAVVTGADALLAGIVVRGRGAAASVVASLALAVFPLAVTADHTVLLEPYLVLFCLVGAGLLFDVRGALASNRRCLEAGIAFGVAGTIKIWAFIPALLALAVSLPVTRRFGRLIAGMFIGFGAITIPFLVGSPDLFVREVITDQLTRHDHVDALNAAERFVLMSGTGGFTAAGDLSEVVNRQTIGVGVAVVFLLLVIVASFVRGRAASRMERYVLGSTVLVVAALCLPKEFYDHYAYFSAAYLGMLAGLVAAVGWERLASIRQRLKRARRPGRIVRVAAGAVGVGLFGAAFLNATAYAGPFLSSAVAVNPIVANAIPPDACVTTDDPILAFAANRMSPANSSCSPIVDPFGMWIAEEHAAPPGSPPFAQAFVADWSQAFQTASYVILVVPETDYVPWTPELLARFGRGYRLVLSSPDSYVYENTAFNG